MKTVDDYLARAKEADAHAARCVEGSQQQREFKAIAEQWRALARNAAPRKSPP